MSEAPEAVARCPACEKEEALCVCSSLKPAKTRLQLVILQHPQEPDKELGTAGILRAALPSSLLRVGLSWPNLAAAVAGTKKKPADLPAVNPLEWAVLFFGTGMKFPPSEKDQLLFVGKDKKVSGGTLAEKKGLKGLVVIDGTWSQAKALWWRNAWLLKLRRVVLVPRRPSLYGVLRREPRKECLSTLESAAKALTLLGEDPAIETMLRGAFEEFLGKVKASGARLSKSV